MTNGLVTVYDSVNVGAIPWNALCLLGYVDGKVPEIAGNYAAVRARFPLTGIVSVTTTGQSRAMMCDCERYDLTPEMVRTWTDSRLYMAPLPVVYASVSRFSRVLSAMRGHQWWWWAADWTGVPHLVPGSHATQYADPATSGGDYDVSVAKLSLLDALFSPPPPPKKGPKMIIVNNGTTQYILFDDGSVIPIDTPEDLAALAEVLPGSVTLSPAMVARFTQR